MDRPAKRMRVVLVLLLAVLQPVATAEWQPDETDRRQLRAADAVQKIRTEVERSHPFFEDAYAYAVWPGIVRLGFGFGGAYGRGIVVEQDEAVGTVSYWQFSSGIQAGVKSFAMIVFFRDKVALESLKRNEIQFAGQAGIDVATVGAHGTPTYNQGVAIIPLTNLGLMADFSASGVKYRYKPYDELSAKALTE